jgi:hypothetical protein
VSFNELNSFPLSNFKLNCKNCEIEVEFCLTITTSSLYQTKMYLIWMVSTLSFNISIKLKIHFSGKRRIRLGLGATGSSPRFILLELHRESGAWRHAGRTLWHQTRIWGRKPRAGAYRPRDPPRRQVQLLPPHRHQAFARISSSKFYNPFIPCIFGTFLAIFLCVQVLSM